MVTDPISDMLTRMRNAIYIGRENVYVPDSKIKREILKIMQKSGYIEKFEVTKDEKPMIVVSLKFNDQGPAISQLSRESKPGRRVYAGKQDIPRVLSGRGIVIISTPRGIMTGAEAKEAGVGGELICKVW